MTRSLLVRVISLENVLFSSLMPIDFNSISSSSNTPNDALNVYVRIELLSPPATTNNCHNIRSIHQRKMAKTRSIRQRQCPIYDEAFEFRGGDDLDELFANLSTATQTTTSTNCFRLVFNVCNSNMYGRDQILGLAVHNLLACDLNNRSQSEQSFILLINSTDNNNNNNLVDLPPRIYSKKVDLVDTKVRITLVFKLTTFKSSFLNRKTFFRIRTFK